jgi:hypothetical protein
MTTPGHGNSHSKARRCLDARCYTPPRTAKGQLVPHRGIRSRCSENRLPHAMRKQSLVTRASLPLERAACLRPHLPKRRSRLLSRQRLLAKVPKML